jgi:protein-arginine kinase activator protein McsA
MKWATHSPIKEEGEPYEEPVNKKRGDSSATAETLLLSNCEFEWETFEDDNEVEGAESYCSHHQQVSAASDCDIAKIQHLQDSIDDRTFQEPLFSSEEEVAPESLIDYIEVTPGLVLPLRGSEETLHAVKIDFLTSSSCLCCEQTLHCIQDANYVLCSDCYVVNPVEANSSGGEYSSVGLGMKDEDLAECREKVANLEFD